MRWRDDDPYGLEHDVRLGSGNGRCGDLKADRARHLSSPDLGLRYVCFLGGPANIPPCQGQNRLVMSTAHYASLKKAFTSDIEPLVMA